MTTAPALTPGGEDAWLRMRLHLEWCDDFTLVFVFSDQPAVARVLRERLAAIYRARITGLEVPVPQTEAELLRDLLPRLLNPPSYQQALAAPIWLDLSRPPVGEVQDTAAWQAVRLQFLARLNEQREPLRRALTRPLILVMPLAEKARIKALVPDLWAVRRFSLDLGPWLAAPDSRPGTDTDARPAETLGLFPLDPTEESLVQEWRRLRDQGAHKGSILTRLVGWLRHPRERSVRTRDTLLAGDRAFKVLLRRQRIDEAREITRWLVETARARLAMAPDDPEALRDLSVSLDNIGRTDQALGDWTQARAAYAEGLEIAERLAAVLPDHVDYKDLPAGFAQRLEALAEAEAGARQGAADGPD